MAARTQISLTLAAALMAIGVYAATGSGETAAQAASSSQIVIGETLPPDSLHLIERPGLYGLGPEPPGSRYAVANGHLIRIDAKTLQVLSVLRIQDRVLD